MTPVSEVITWESAEQPCTAPERRRTEKENSMLNDPTMHYELFKARQRERWQKAEQARQARAATPDQIGPVERLETTTDLTGLAERVIQRVWKRLGLPARESAFRQDHERIGLPSGPIRPVHPADVSL